MTTAPTQEQQATPVKQDNLLGAPSEKLLENDIVNVYLMQVRTISWMTDDETAWRIIGKPRQIRQHNLLSDPRKSAEDIGVEFADIRDTTFAKAVQDMYRFAYFGIQDGSGESMTNQSIYTWIAALLVDIRHSAVSNEWWDGHGGDGDKSSERCVRIAELANARMLLETGETFYWFSSANKDDAPTGGGGLTIRHMALLSGLEEMSVRAAANPKRANPLKTYSDEGRTRVDRDVATTWLQSKGLYIPVTRRWGAGDIDIATRKFRSVDEFIVFLGARRTSIGLRDGCQPEIDARLAALGIAVEAATFGNISSLAMRREQMTDPTLMSKVARILDMPERLLAVRAREALANDDLASVERELRSILNPN